MVKINGTWQDAAGMTLKEFLAGADYSTQRIAVERNGEIIPKSMYESTVLEEEDRLEIVSFVGGG